MNGSIVFLSATRSRPTASARRRRHATAIEARRQLEGVSLGRAWINGREVGGTAERFAHLSASYD